MILGGLYTCRRCRRSKSRVNGNHTALQLLRAPLFSPANRYRTDRALDSKMNDSVLGVGAALCVTAGITAGNLGSDFDTARLGKMRRSD